MTLRSQTQKIKLKFFGVIREIIVVMVAISKNTILLGILLMLMGMLLLIICTYIASIFGLISHPSPPNNYDSRHNSDCLYRGWRVFNYFNCNLYP